jgi:hypothetical protein
MSAKTSPRRQSAARRYALVRAVVGRMPRTPAAIDPRAIELLTEVR